MKSSTPSVSESLRIWMPSLFSAKEAQDATLSRADRLVAAFVTILLLLLFWKCSVNVGWNSDEAQHLHVVWGWAHGLISYRDTFDNHSPLFHIMFSPLLRLVGERPDAVNVMRWAMLPFFGTSLYCVYCLGKKAFSPRVGLWAAMLAAVLPKFFLKMGEFRTDVVWTTFWLLALVILTSGTLTRKRIFITGIVFGAAFSISMKTTLLLLTVVVAGGITWFIRRGLWLSPSLRRTSWGCIASWVGAALGGLVLIPGALIGFYAANGALSQMYYCVIQHNVMPGSHSPFHLLKQLFFSLSTLAFIPALALGATAIPHLRDDPERGSRRMFLLLTAGLFYPLLHGLWSMITPQDNIPWFPLLFVALTPGLLWLGNWISLRLGVVYPRLVVPIAVLAGGIAWLFHSAEPFHCDTGHNINFVREALRLTDPGDFLMDAKGETIFRQRPYYYVLETLTRKRIMHKLIPDDVPERLIQTHTAVVMDSERMTRRALEFVHNNYVRVGYLYVAGKNLESTPNGIIHFEIAVPQRYSFTDGRMPLAGTIDGKPIEAAQWLESGVHEVHVAGRDGRPAVLWSQAIERGFHPLRAHSRKANPAQEHIHPEALKSYERIGYGKGGQFVASGSSMRS